MPPSHIQRQNWQMVAIFLCFFLFFISETLSLWNALRWRPHFLLIAIYYIALYKASNAPVIPLFILGLLRDGYFGYPMGQSSFIYLLIFFMGKGHRSLFKVPSILSDWAGFACMTIIAGSLQWLISGLLQDIWVHPGRLFIGALLTSALYPVGTWVVQHLVQLFDKLRRCP